MKALPSLLCFAVFPHASFFPLPLFFFFFLFCRYQGMACILLRTLLAFSFYFSFWGRKGVSCLYCCPDFHPHLLFISSKKREGMKQGER
jgi:hypothetical protein